MTRKLKIFVSYSLARDSKLVEQLISVLGKDKYDYFIPGDEMPLSGHYTAPQILEGNVSGVKGADIVIGLLNKPGEGVGFELGVAYTLGKPIVLYQPHDLANQPDWWKDPTHALYSANRAFEGLIDSVRQKGRIFTQFDTTLNPLVESAAAEVAAQESARKTHRAR